MEYNKISSADVQALISLVGIDYSSIDNESREDLDFVCYDLGKERTVEEFERYVGLDFKGKRIHQHTLEHKLLPVPYTNEEEWEKLLFKRYCSR